MSNSRQPQRQLTLLDTTCITVGIIIGAGIYRSSPSIAASVSGPGTLLLVWLLGGVAALVGALCYAELATAYPHEGGDYVFLTKAYGKRLGFLFAWAEFWIIRPASIGAMAYVFARYAHELLPLGLETADLLVYTCTSIVVLTLINLLGVQTGKWTQNILTIIKVAGLVAIFLVALLIEPASVSSASSSALKPNYYLAFILVLFTYGGWSDTVYVAAEVQHPERNILRALVLGTTTVTVVYLLVNVALLWGLGFAGLARSPAAAADLAERALGAWGARLLSGLICLSCLGAINGMIFTSARIYYALGSDDRLFAWLGHWNERLGTPVRSLVLQSLVTLGLVLTFGTREDAFDQLVTLAAPFVWFFFLMVGVGLFLLRWREPDRPRAYRVHLYPLTPILFCLSNLLLLYASIAYLAAQPMEPRLERFWALLVVFSGLALCLRPFFGRAATRKER